ncbi:MAG: fumarylacetoacetate hydrolase family protein [Duncaniella sp.]|nr:fumarylacetoacetate hydrolase family protein [Duncaniella sp.]MDE7146163.1 fumarylacetoacetate hydrolase family protein [Duncaniella sp.]
MKIISVHRLDPSLVIDIHPDSTVVLPGRPFFLPEDGDLRVARAHVAVRISRLGKNISRKFAPRYYDGITVGLRLTPAGEIADEMKGVVSAMDSSTVFGEWREPSVAEAEMEANVGGVTCALGGLLPQIDCAISEISKYMTLKMGDVVMLPVFYVTPELVSSMRLVVEAGGTVVLDLKVV